MNNNDWSELNVAIDVNAAYELFINKFLQISGEKLPITVKRTNSYSKNHKPWVTSAILKKSLQDKTPESKQKYKKIINNLTTVIHFAEKITMPKNLKWPKEILEKLG